MSKNLEIPSVLACERKLDPSDAIFHAGHWNDREDASRWAPIPIRSKCLRGTISNRLKTKDQDPAKLDADIEKPNLQTVDVATLPTNADTLRVQFTLRVLAGAGTPSVCNKVDYQKQLVETVRIYREKEGFTELAKRYAANLANGRFLWRNRIGAENVQVKVALLKDGEPEQSRFFDALSLDFRKLDSINDDGVQSLGTVIADGLTGKKRHVLLQVTAFARVGAGQEVFPSQELVLNNDKSKNKVKQGKTLYAVAGVAAIHSQKIGNALRTIDTWYEDADEWGPIAVEPYGAVTTRSMAHRQPKRKRDFYTLLDNWLLNGKEPSMEQQHYVMAVLIRGGVFGEAESKKTSDEASDDAS
ncbi:type I-F CRISPR-associated protein Csy3 [Verminephrobacter aporrectodeae subsp. tuberculatae]|uniref:type I-F CRISPR-associated protein Csy3 n=1 Tax=Verminephrobacter aporrectodeae TaxID=1110389 RepID=UPI0022438AF2|nr:type I-F CRISPR-associated protein Csy3 [Verminephrobacter aporrectodeae]MCW8208211.1 type I-F CRISPR-associated protein Csy3 [Verminephrobacter aporrectodeae subsp. tuberculatae]